MVLHISSAIVAFGMILSFFFASLLFAKPCRGGANRYLAGLVLATGLSISYEVLFPTGLYRALPFLVKTYIPGQFLIGPLLFLYVSAIVEPDFRFRRGMLLHFLPFALSILYLLPFFLEPSEAKIAFVETSVSPALPSRAEEWIVWLCLQAGLWVYSILSMRLYWRHRRNLRDSVSDMHRYGWNWLLVFLSCVLAMLVSYAVVDVLMLGGIPLVAFDPYISIALTGSIIFLGWRGLLRLDYISPPPSEERAAAPRPEERKPGEWQALFARSEEATRRSAWFRSPELTLPELAQSLGCSRTAALPDNQSRRRAEFL